MRKELGGGARRGLLGLEDLRKTLEMLFYAAGGVPTVGPMRRNRKLQSLSTCILVYVRSGAELPTLLSKCNP